MTLPSYIEDILDYTHKDSNLPIGVSKQIGTPKPYKAELIINGKKCYLGVFESPLLAHKHAQYKVFKNAIDCLNTYHKDERFRIEIAILILSHAEKIARDIQDDIESLKL